MLESFILLSNNLCEVTQQKLDKVSKQSSGAFLEESFAAIFAIFVCFIV
jgi:hypothetical protein